MPTTYYDTLHGEIIAEYTDGVQLDYLKDALGSVTAWVDQNCNIVATARYKPFGDILVSTGTLGRFTWVGTLGYRTTGLGVANFYVRARHYASQQGLWNTVDPLWPKEAAYGYANESPVSLIDPSGRGCIFCNFVKLNPSNPFGCEKYERCERWRKPRTGPNWKDNTANLIWCVQCLGKHKIEDRAAAAGRGDKQMHCIAGCLAAILCDTPCPDNIGWLKELSDCAFGGTFGIDDAVATDDGWDIGRRYADNSRSLNIDILCKQQCAKTGW